MRVDVLGRVAHGIAGDGVFVDDVQIAPGGGQNGMPDWFGDRVIWPSGQHNAVVSAFPDGSDLRTETSLASFVRASAHGWAAWTATGGPGGESLTWTSWGLKLPGSLLLDMAPDGTLLVGDSYQQPNGISAYRVGDTEPLWRVDGAVPASFYPYVQASILEATTAAWTEPAGGYNRVFRAYGLPPLQLPWSVLHPTLTRVDGEVWVTYLRQPGDEIVSHPWDFTGKGLIADGTGFGPLGVGRGATCMMLWSTTAGERAGTIMVNHQLASDQRLLEMPPPVEVPPVPPIEGPPPIETPPVEVPPIDSPPAEVPPPPVESPNQEESVTHDQIAAIVAGGFFNDIVKLLKLNGSVEAVRPKVHAWQLARIAAIDRAYLDIFGRHCDLEGFGSRMRLYIEHGWSDERLRKALEDDRAGGAK